MQHFAHIIKQWMLTLPIEELYQNEIVAYISICGFFSPVSCVDYCYMSLQVV